VTTPFYRGKQQVGRFIVRDVTTGDDYLFVVSIDPERLPLIANHMLDKGIVIAQEGPLKYELCLAQETEPARDPGN